MKIIFFIDYNGFLVRWFMSEKTTKWAIISQNHFCTSRPWYLYGTFKTCKICIVKCFNFVWLLFESSSRRNKNMRNSITKVSSFLCWLHSSRIQGFSIKLFNFKSVWEIKERFSARYIILFLSVQEYRVILNLKTNCCKFNYQEIDQSLNLCPDRGIVNNFVTAMARKIQITHIEK